MCVSQRKYRLHGGHKLTNIDGGNYTYKIAAVSLSGNGSYTPLMYFVIPPKPGECDHLLSVQTHSRSEVVDPKTSSCIVDICFSVHLWS